MAIYKHPRECNCGCGPREQVVYRSLTADPPTRPTPRESLTAELTELRALKDLATRYFAARQNGQPELADALAWEWGQKTKG